MIEYIDAGRTVFPIVVELDSQFLLRCTWFANTLSLSQDTTTTDVTVTQLFEVKKWFFLEIGSSSTGYYGSLRFKNGSPYVAMKPPSGYLLTSSHRIHYPRYGSGPTFTVRAM
jgi:hypothetical protein